MLYSYLNLSSPERIEIFIKIHMQKLTDFGMVVLLCCFVLKLTTEKLSRSAQVKIGVSGGSEMNV